MKPILAATLVVAAVAPVASAAPDPAIAWSTPIGVDTTTHGRGTFVSSIRNGVALFSGTATQSAAAHVAVDTATGTVRWTQLMERSGSALLAPDGSAYVNGYEFDRGDLLTRIGSDGARQNKTELIAFWTADGFDPSPVTVTEPIEHVWPDGAALGGTVILSWMQDRQPVSVTLRYIDVWALRDGQWRVVYGQSTRVP